MLVIDIVTSAKSDCVHLPLLDTAAATLQWCDATAKNTVCVCAALKLAFQVIEYKQSLTIFFATLSYIKQKNCTHGCSIC